jgi:hypothetical protein
MKKMTALFFAVLMFIPLTALSSEDSTFSEETGDCFSKVAQITGPKLDALRNWMRSKKAKDGKSYYEVYRLYDGFWLSARDFKVLNDSADDIQLSAAFAIGFCNKSFGNMDENELYVDPKGQDEPIVIHLSAHEHLTADTLPKIADFYKIIDRFIKRYYNVKVVK